MTSVALIMFLSGNTGLYTHTEFFQLLVLPAKDSFFIAFPSLNRSEDQENGIFDSYTDNAASSNLVYSKEMALFQTDYIGYVVNKVLVISTPKIRLFRI